MAISVSCGECGHSYTVKDEAAGRKFRCKACGNTIDVPVAAGGVDDEFGAAVGDDEESEFDNLGDLPPRAGSGSRGQRTSAALAADRVKVPAICLIVLASLWVLFNLGRLALSIAGFVVAAQQQPVNVSYAVGFCTALLFFVILSIIELTGAIKLLKLQSYATVRTAMILCVIPCCSPLVILGIPFGIWALVVLNDPGVKAAFRS